MNDNSKKSNPRADVSAAFNYLVDEPAIEDRFGAHTAIVNAIVSTLRTQRHIRLIGLIGRWGTGKSTIVGRLAATLQHKHKDEYVLFAYDAWAHQGDPARRSILEELIARLVGLKLTKPSKWRDTLLAVSGSSESSSTTTRTRLSTWGKFVVAMLLMFPVFAVLIDSETLRKAFADYPDRLSLILIRAFLLYVMLVGLIIFAAHVFTKEYRPLFDRQIPFRDRLRAFRASGEDILSIMLTRRFPGTSSTTLRKSQPTAIEFRRYLRRIIESQRPRRIIFVIDNLDRINPPEALDIWSIMVGMVADEAHRMDVSIEPIVVLPFDPVALSKIVPSGKLDCQTASDLIEKSFDVTFEVPPPVLSNWRSYFAEQYARSGLRDAGGDSTFEEYWSVRNFEACLGTARVTPRKINRFLNKVISLSQQQCEHFAPTIVSYYVAHESKIQEDCLVFLKSNQPGFDDTKSWQLKIAAIAFGTTEDEAAQVLLGERLIDALTSRDLAAFEDISEVAGFVEVVRNFIENAPRDSSGSFDSGPLTALAVFCAKTHQAEDSVLWTRLWRAWKAAPFSGADTFASAAIRAFIENIPSLTETDASFLGKRILDQVGGARDTEVVKELMNVGDGVLRLAPDRFETDIGDDPTILLKALRAASVDSAFAASLKCSCSFEDLAELVLNSVSGKLAIFASSDFRLIDTRISTNQIAGEKSSFFEAVGEGLKDLFSNVEAADQSLIAASEILASQGEKGRRYLQIIADLQNSGTLPQAVERAVTNDAPDVVSVLTALQMTGGQQPSASLETWLAENENTKRLIASISGMNDGGFLPVLRNLEAKGNDVDWILKPVVVEAVNGKDIGRLVHTDWLLKNFKKVAAWLSPVNATVYAGLLITFKGSSAAIGELNDSDFLFFMGKLPAATAKPLLGERIANFDAGRFAGMVFNADEVWHAFSRLTPDIGKEHSAKSVLFKALHDVLNGSMGAFGSRTANRGLKLARLLTPAALNQLVRSVVVSAVGARKPEAIIALAGIDVFGPYIGRPSVAASIIEALFVELKRLRDGKLLIERNATAMSGMSNSAQGRIRKALLRGLRSRDERTAGWARFVLDRSGLER